LRTGLQTRRKTREAFFSRIRVFVQVVGAHFPVLHQARFRALFSRHGNEKKIMDDVMPRGTTFIIASVITFVAAVASLTATPCSVTTRPFFTCGAIISVEPVDFTLDVSDPVDPATLDASDFTVNGIPADNVTLANGNLTIEFVFNNSPAVPGINTMHIPAGAFNCVINGPVLEFTCAFGVRIIPPRPFPTPHPR
jgi:hypothetical protein